MSNKINLTKIDVKFNNKLTNRKDTIGIVLHHLDANNAGIKEVHQWHLKQGWEGIGYHFIVRFNGVIEWSRGIDTFGIHTLNNNHNTIGIAFEGKYEELKSMPDEQFKSGVELIKYVKSHYHKNLTVKQHKDYRATACPGRYFPFTKMLEEVNNKNNNTNVNQTINQMINNEIHKVVKGDTLYSLSKMYNITVKDLQIINDKGSSTNIKIGDKLRVSLDNEKIYKGLKIGLDNSPLYASSDAKTKTRNITGGFWIWNDKIVNERIRITNSLSNVGKANQITGWINVNSIK